MLKKTLKRSYMAVQKAAGGLTSAGTKRALHDLNVPNKLDEVLYHLDRVKRAVTFKTGEFEALTQLFTGQKMYVDTRDISLAPHLMLDGIWEPEITHIFRRHVEPEAVVLDIGANFGYFGLIAGAELNRNKGQIHLFEANPDLAPYIFKTLAINGLLNSAQIVSKAVSDKPGHVELTVLEDFWGSSGIGLNEDDKMSVAGRKIGVRNRVKVPTITIDDYVRENKLGKIDVIKMDIEGYEDTAYKGMRQTIKKSPKLKLFIEFTDGAYKNAEKFFKQLHDDFGSIYAITTENGGKLVPVKSYAAMKRAMNDAWIMLLASKQPIAVEA